MNPSTPQPDSTRSARPELFGANPAQAASRSSAEPSILASIDGGPVASPSARRGVTLWAAGWVAVVIGGAGLWGWSTFSGPSSSAKLAARPASAVAQIASVQPRQAPAVASNPIRAASTQIAAASASLAASHSDTTVIPMAAAQASSEGRTAVVADHRAEDRARLKAARKVAAAASAAEREASAKASKKQGQRERQSAEPQVVADRKAASERKAKALLVPAKPASAVAANNKPAPAVARDAPGSADNDARLIEAMLPHLPRVVHKTTSKAFRKACGHLSGDAQDQCRVKFCAGPGKRNIACTAAAR